MIEQITKATLQTATHLAASGQYQAASALLDSCDPSEHSVAVSLLRAKIAVQQGRYEEAIKHWQEVLAMDAGDAGNQEANDGMELAERLRTKRGSRFYLRANLYYAILLTAIVGLVVLLLVMVSRSARRVDNDQLRAMLETQGQQLQLSNEMKKTLNSLAARSGREASTGTAGQSDLKIDVPGVVTVKDDDGLTLKFEQGLFKPRGAELKAEAMNTLLTLGRQLEPQGRNISISVIGHTDNAVATVAARYSDNSALALARAVAVVEFLRTKTRIPGEVLAARALADSLAPYPNDTPDGRARNRTVVIRIVRTL